MIFKGNKYRLNKNIVILPHEAGDPYIEFGYVCDKEDKDAIKVEYTTEDNEDVYAKPIHNHGHSLTNLMYGSKTNKKKATHMYLCHKGICYTSPLTRQ